MPALSCPFHLLAKSGPSGDSYSPAAISPDGDLESFYFLNNRIQLPAQVFVREPVSLVKVLKRSPLVDRSLRPTLQMIRDKGSQE